MDNRLTRIERTSLIVLICLETLANDCESDLGGRIPDREAWTVSAEKAKAELGKMISMVLATLLPEQLQHLKKTARDYELRLKPKLTPRDSNQVLDKETLRTLIDAAQAKCTDCFKSEAESRNCKLQKLLAILTPMPSYDTGLCVYNNREWEN